MVGRNYSNYKSYLSAMGIREKGKYLFCELDGMGSSAYYLNHYFHGTMDSAYLERIHCLDLYDAESINIFDNKNTDREYSPIRNYLVILENLFSSPDPSFAGIHDDGTFEYDSEFRCSADLVLLSDIQDIAIETVLSDFREKKLRNTGILSKALVQRVFESVSEVELKGECEAIKHWTLRDEMTGTIFPGLVS